METNDSESKMLGERCIFLLYISAISVAISDFKRKKFIFNKGVDVQCFVFPALAKLYIV